jgi:long-chain fatty acid transport protein
VAACLVVLSSGRLTATDGYFSLGYGTQSKGVAGAGVAIAIDTLAPALNPATLVFVADQIDLGASLFNPNRSYRLSATRHRLDGRSHGRSRRELVRELAGAVRHPATA